VVKWFVMDFHPEALPWEAASCDWCGSTETSLLFEGPDRLEHLPGTFRLVRCKRCGLYRQNPRLSWEGLKHYYPEDYASHGKLVQEEKGALRQLDKRYGPWKRLRAIERYQPGGECWKSAQARALPGGSHPIGSLGGGGDRAKRARRQLLPEPAGR